jgi:hypothetical protein
MTMDEVSPTDNALQRMRVKVDTETFHVVSTEERSISRSRAMRELEPLVDEFDQSNSTANFVTNVKTFFTKESVKVLSKQAKRTIRLAAEVVGDKDVLRWIAAAKEDKEEHKWNVITKKPKPTADIFPQLLEDLDVLVQAAPSNIQGLLRSRVQVVKMAFELFEERISVEASYRLIEELSSAYKALSSPIVLKSPRVVPDDEPADDSSDEPLSLLKRRIGRTPA